MARYCWQQRAFTVPTQAASAVLISRVNAMRYAKNVMLAVLQHVAHASGILYQRRSDTSEH